MQQLSVQEDTLKSTELALSQAQSRTAAILHQQVSLSCVLRTSVHGDCLDLHCIVTD